MAPQQDKKVNYIASKAECRHLTGAKFITKLFPGDRWRPLKGHGMGLIKAPGEWVESEAETYANL